MQESLRMRAGSPRTSCAPCARAFTPMACASRCRWRLRITLSRRRWRKGEGRSRFLSGQHTFGELGAIGARLVDAEHAQMGGEEFELFECQPDRPFRRMALDVGIELGRGELAFELIGFELDHVDAVGSEAAERLVEGSWNIPHPEDERGDDRGIFGLG